ncbi:hypothetical protein LIER_02385 [Lithospermum erythrorhizon]|uniref:RNase H type-1 domain-containing protein n=1 Tax=Lithospermum erythrorhizon TaxID=34254 RepID=A0AAV3NPZ2_LITER
MHRPCTCRRKAKAKGKSSNDETRVIQVDGASKKGGKRAGVWLHAPDGVHIPYLLKLEFKATNNDTEYEALIAGLRPALSMAAKKVVVQSDSQVMVNQVNDECATIAENLVKYRDWGQQLLRKFEEVRVDHIPRSSNESADILSKITALPYEQVVRYAPIEVVTRRAHEVLKIMTIYDEPNWMNLMVDYLTDGVLPTDKNEARHLKHKAATYALVAGNYFVVHTTLKL